MLSGDNARPSKMWERPFSSVGRAEQTAKKAKAVAKTGLENMMDREAKVQGLDVFWARSGLIYWVLE